MNNSRYATRLPQTRSIFEVNQGELLKKIMNNPMRRTAKSAVSLITVLGVLGFVSKEFGQSPSGTLGGRAVEDLTGNGFSADDAPITGRVIRLFRDNGDKVFNASDPFVKSDTTRKDGGYSFRNLAAGVYFVQQDLPRLWVQTVPASGESDVLISPAECGPTPKEHNDTIPTAIATGLTGGAPGVYRARGEIGDNNYQSLDVDMFQVEINAGGLIRVDLDAISFGSTLDAVLRIFDANGRPLAADDDEIGGGLD